MNIESQIRLFLLPRKPESHKGDYGRVFILAGSLGLSGACILTSSAAIRSGAGLVTIGVPKSLLLPLSKRLTEAMMKPLPETSSGTLSLKAFQPILKFLRNQDVFALGPGLSQEKETQTLIRKVVLSSTKPLVIDADGLNAFVEKTNSFRKLKAPAILTPHPGEFVRLFGGKIPVSKSERIKRALSISTKFKVVLVLKGNGTVVASPNGKFFVNTTGNPGMATGGSGDVLVGVIAALLGQKLKPFDAAKAGVYLHGLAGDLAKKKFGEISLKAGDIIDFLPQAFRMVLKR